MIPPAARRATAAALACLIFLAPSPAAGPFAQRRPSRPAVSAAFERGRDSARVPFDLFDDLILVRATVNDSAPLWFIFDTGASATVVNAKLAGTLRLKSRGRVRGTGGAGTAVATRLERVRVGFEGVGVSGLTVYALDLDFLSAHFGRELGGVIGNDVIARFVVEIDYAGRALVFHPRGHVYRGTAAPLPLTIEGEGLPYARALISLRGRPAVEGKFEIDTGSTGSILFNTPFVKRHNLTRAVSRSRATRVGGVGGSADALLARVEGVTLGPFTLREPVARLSLGAKGSNASRSYDGLLGGEIFRRFKMTVDLTRRRLYLEPNAELGAPFEEDMSGIELLGDGPDFKTYLIDEVEAGSAAAAAGVEGGDVLAAIDGRPAAELSLDEIRRMFRRDGVEYRLDLRRGERNLRVTLKLRRVV